MDNKIRMWLTDMQSAIAEIFEFLPKERNFLNFEKDIKTRRAVERNIEILGEAMNRILKEDPTFPITNAKRIVDTRNRVIHGYDTVSSSIIWAIVTRELPKLEKELQLLLSQNKA